MKIGFSAFRGTVPRLSEALLPEGHAQKAADCDLRSGDIIPVADSEDAGALTLGDTIAAIYPFRVGGTVYWLRFHDDVNVIGSPVVNEANQRVYWSGDRRFTDEGLCAYSYAPAAYTGGLQYPVNYWKLGIPAPTVAPTCAVSGTPPDNPNEEVRYYVYTFVGAHGEEGPPSPVSDMVSVAHSGATVSLSGMNIPGDVSSNREITAIRIYRTVSGEFSTTFLFVGEIPYTESTYDDTRDAAALTDELETTTYHPPRDGLQGLVLMSNGIAAGFVDRDVCISKQYLPYAWPTASAYPMNYDVVAIGHYDYHLIVGTKGRPAMITVQDDASAYVQELPINEACVSAKSMVSMGWCAIYASPNGLVMATASGAQLVSSAVYTKREWDALNPESMHAYEFEGRYVAFWYVDANNKGGIIFDPKQADAGILTTDDWYPLGYRDIATDRLYLLDSDNNLWSWRSGTGIRAATWKSKRVRLGNHVAFSACRVRADDYDNVVVRIYADGALFYEKRVTNDYAFRLPKKGRFKEWEVEVETTARIRTIGLAESVTELQ